MASASKGWLKYRVGLGGVETGLASQTARRVSPGYFRSPSPTPALRPANTSEARGTSDGEHLRPR